MKLEYIQNPTEWDSLLKSFSSFNPFVQTWEWGEILKKEGKHVERVIIKDETKIIFVTQIIFTKLFSKYRYAFCPKGPLFIDQNNSGFELFVNYLKNKHCLFVRTEPKSKIIASIPSKLRKSIDINPRATTYLELKKSETELLSHMHSKTRYNIRLAQKKVVRITEEKNKEIFLKLMKETAKRDGFKLHYSSHYEHILYSELSKQITIWFEDVPIAVGIFIGFGDTFTYLYGASNYTHRNLMAPYLVQWKGIELGKSLGYKYYDFFGIAPLKNEKKIIDNEQTKEYEYDLKHQYAGVTRFKLGFGGNVKEDIGTWDVALYPFKYKVYELIRKIRRMV